MNKQAANKIRPSEDDIHRLRRLSEEIHARALELALILKHTTDFDYRIGQTVRLRSGDPKVKARGDWMEIIEVDGVEACYGVINGEPFAESPCGAS